MIEKLKAWWRLGQPQRVEWSESQWDNAFEQWVNGLSTYDLLRELDWAHKED